MIGFFKRLFCWHRHRVWVRNIHGDEILLSGGKRAIWKCKRCGALFHDDELYRGDA